MNEQDKCLHADKNSFEPKEGEQRRLSCNNVSNCSPSLKLSNTENSEKPESENFIVTPEAIEVFTAFAVTLKKIHVRLVMEGNVIKDGEIFKPGEIDQHEPSNKNNSNT